MKRGIIDLTPDQAKALLEIIKNDVSDELLFEKLTNLANSDEPGVFLSQEEAETLLDAFPPPTRFEDQLTTAVRKKLRRWFTQ